MPGRVRIAEGGGNAITLCFATQLFGNRLPLAWGRFQSDVTIGGNANTIHDDANTALVSFWIEVTKGHHVCASCVKITLSIQFESLSMSRDDCQHQA